MSRDILNQYNSRDFYGLYNTRDFYKGKSFRYNFEWNIGTHYFNDEYIQDFVSYQGSMYVCILSDVGHAPTPNGNNDYWHFVMSGQEGATGETGTIFVPFVDSEGNISWSNDAGLPNPATQNIRGPQGLQGVKGDKGDQGLRGLQGEQGIRGAQGEQGPGLLFRWNNTSLGVKREDDIIGDFVYVDLRGAQGQRGTQGPTGATGAKGDQGETGERGPSIILKLEEINGDTWLMQSNDDGATFEQVFNLEELRGQAAKEVQFRQGANGIEWAYVGENNWTLAADYDDIRGPHGNQIERVYVGTDGYLYYRLTDENFDRRAGYVKGDDGDAKQIILQVDDTGTQIQWKYANTNMLWTNLIHINDLMNNTLRGLSLEYEERYVDGTAYDVISLYNNWIDDDENPIKELINELLIPIQDFLLDVRYDPETNQLIFTFRTEGGSEEVGISVDDFIKAGAGITIEQGNIIGIKLDPASETWTPTGGLSMDYLTVSADGLKLTGLNDKIVRNISAVQAADYIFTVTLTFYDNTTKSITLQNSGLINTVTFNNTTGQLLLTRFDGSEIPVDLSDLINYGLIPDGGLQLINRELGIAPGGINYNMFDQELKDKLDEYIIVISFTHDEMLEAITNGTLNPGTYYVINDYRTIYVENNVVLGSEDSIFPSEQYSIIVQALGNNSLTENAFVLEHPRWNIRYNINHTIPQDKGTIEYMEDEYGNAAGYDFYNRLWYRTNEKLQPEFVVNKNPNIVVNIEWTGINGIYCYTYSDTNNFVTSNDGTAVRYENALKSMNKVIYGNKLTLNIEYPVDGYGCLNNVFFLPLLTMYNTSCERGFSDNTFHVTSNQFLDNKLSGTNNDVFVNSFASNQFIDFNNNNITCTFFTNNTYTSFRSNDISTIGQVSLLTGGNFIGNNIDIFSSFYRININIVSNVEWKNTDPTLTEAIVSLIGETFESCIFYETLMNNTNMPIIRNVTSMYARYAFFTGGVWQNCNLNGISNTDRISITNSYINGFSGLVQGKFTIIYSEIFVVDENSILGIMDGVYTIINSSIHQIKQSWIQGSIEESEITLMDNIKLYGDLVRCDVKLVSNVEIEINLYDVEINNWVLGNTAAFTSDIRTILSVHSDINYPATDKSLSVIDTTTTSGTIYLTYFDGDRLAPQSIKLAI